MTEKYPWLKYHRMMIEDLHVPMIDGNHLRCFACGLAIWSGTRRTLCPDD